MHSDQKYEFFSEANPSLLTDVVCSDSSILPEELATQSVRLKEEQLRREEEKVRPHTLSRSSRTHLLPHLAPRDRTQGPARDQREAPGAARKGGVAAEPREPPTSPGLDAEHLTVLLCRFRIPCTSRFSHARAWFRYPIHVYDYSVCIYCGGSSVALATSPLPTYLPTFLLLGSRSPVPAPFLSSRARALLPLFRLTFYSRSSIYTIRREIPLCVMLGCLWFGCSHWLHKPYYEGSNYEPVSHWLRT